MYVLIDTQHMAILCRCEKVEVLRSLVNIEFSHISVRILEETYDRGFKDFSVERLQNLFKSLTGGTDPYSHNTDYLIGQISRLCQTIVPKIVDGFQATLQSLQIKPSDSGRYRYAHEKNCAEEMDDSYQPPALVGNWSAAQGLTLPSVATAPPMPAQQAQTWTAQPATPPKYAPPWL